MSAQVAADLRAAADVLERDGWTRQDYAEDYSNPESCKCVYGALHYVASGGTEVTPTDTRSDENPRIRSAASYLAAQIGASVDWPSVYVVEWNDEGAKDAAEVIAALRAAADRAEAES